MAEWKRIVVSSGPLQDEAAVALLIQPYDALYGPKGFKLHAIEPSGKVTNGRERITLVYVK